ncbi:polysaccharide deacetylase family protein [Psychrosphaera sp. 1_MG-2023]|uniref:polysaccharide deacetylase family protein n=1 Tax=Psychrosphaera sp. 1_MG-2023 TaxID=3062643 RepID=UPI0026E13344|nr:polysaccharide deacetylase family protein [Psychrosphaera sp. 1_MG-2023]MDO6719012.1 polysaccharide deacetylase family protein [Psychrosphaera sp. 1_MG-2023]
MNHLLSTILTVLLAIFVFAVSSTSAQAATVVIYHHVSENTPASTSLSPEDFIKHLTLFEELELEVVPLSKLVNAIQDKQDVPSNWVAITFDDGFTSVYDNAMPELQKRKYPFTVFVNPDKVGPSKLYMDWQQLREITKAGGEIANHTLAHENLVQTGLTLNEIKANLAAAEKAITKNTGQAHNMVAYPFGEYNDIVKTALKELGMVGFAQHSGAIDKYSDLQALTRFPAAGIYANPKTLKNKVLSLPFSVKSYSPTDTTPINNPPKFVVELAKKDFYQSQLACFVSGFSDPVKPTWIDDLTFEITATDVIGLGRVKYNCTAPSISHAGKYYWMSKLWINLDGTD